MNIFTFIFYLGIINIIFGFIWKWFFVLPSAFLFAIIKFDYGMRFVKLFGSYLLVSLTSLLTLVAIGVNSDWRIFIAYSSIGIFVLLMSYTSNLYEAKKQASINSDWQILERLEQDSVFEMFLMLMVIIFYIFVLFNPVLATNELTKWLLGTINWVFDLPIIGWLIGIGGVLFLLNITFYGLVAIWGLAALILNKFRANKVLN